MQEERLARLETARDEIGRELSRISDQHGLSAADLLALMSFMTGACIAYQDQRTMTPTSAMRLVYDNLEAGNRAAMELVGSAGGTPQ